MPFAAYAHPFLDRRFPDGVRVARRRGARSPRRRLRRCRAPGMRRGLRGSSMSSTVTAISDTSCSARASEAAATADALENRTRFLRSVIEGISAAVPQLGIAVRLSAFDTVPYREATTIRHRRRRNERRLVSLGVRPARRRLSTPRSRMRAGSWHCSRSSACAGSASPEEARTTTRTCSGRRCFRRSTATIRPRTRSRRCAADRGDGDGSRRRFLASYSSDPPTATCRSGCRTSRSTPSARA